MAKGEAIVITSGKGGVGKTTAVANIGAALAAQGKRVVMVDTDIGLRNLDVILGLENKIVFDLMDVVEGNCKVRQALINDMRAPDLLYLLPAPQTRDKGFATPKQMREMVRKLKEEFDYVIIDCPAGIDKGFESAVSGAQHAIIVTMPEVSAVRDADRVAGLLEAHDLTQPRLLINRIRPKMVSKGDMLSIQDMVTVLGIDLIGIVPDDESIIKGSNLGQAIIGMDSAAATAYNNIARRILGEEVALMQLTKASGRRPWRWVQDFFTKNKEEVIDEQA